MRRNCFKAISSFLYLYKNKFKFIFKFNFTNIEQLESYRNIILIKKEVSNICL